MPGLHFEDTCVTDEDCVDFPQTVCRSMPVNMGLDPGTRELPFDKWKLGDEILMSCWCKARRIRRREKPFLGLNGYGTFMRFSPT